MSKSLKKLIDINRLREFKNKLVGTGSAYVQTGAVDQTIAGTKTFSKPIVGSVTGSSGSCTGNAATANIATKATQDAAGNTITTTYATKAENNTKANNSEVVHKSGDETIAGTKTFSNGVLSTAVNAFMAQNKGYTVLLRNDGSATYLLISDKDGVPGTWSDARPLTISNSTGVCSINGNASTATTATNATNAAKLGNIASSGYVQTGKVNQTIDGTKTFSAAIVGSVTGNAGSATKLATARTINGTAFNGTANITTANWGTARNISITDGTNTSTAVSVNGSANVSLNLPATIKANLTGNCSGSSGSCTGNAATATTAATAKACTGNAATATKLATARSLWGNNFDGSAAITGVITGTPGIEFKPTATTANNGGVLDFHYNQSTADYTSRIIESASGTLSINNVTITTGKVVTAATFNGALKGNVTGNCSGSSGSCTGNAATATKLAAKRTIALSGAATGTATGFDGSGNITIPVTSLDASKLTGTASVSTTGNAATATTADNGVDSQGGHWIRFKNGIQICWAKIPCAASGASPWTYGESFSSKPVVTVCDQGSNTNVVYLTRAGNIGTTSCLIVMVDENGGSYATGVAQCIAIGRWKELD